MCFYGDWTTKGSVVQRNKTYQTLDTQITCEWTH